MKRKEKERLEEAWKGFLRTPPGVAFIFERHLFEDEPLEGDETSEVEAVALHAVGRERLDELAAQVEAGLIVESGDNEDEDANDDEEGEDGVERAIDAAVARGLVDPAYKDELRRRGALSEDVLVGLLAYGARATAQLVERDCETTRAKQSALRVQGERAARQRGFWDEREAPPPSPQSKPRAAATPPPAPRAAAKPTPPPTDGDSFDPASWRLAPVGTRTN